MTKTYQAALAAHNAAIAAYKPVQAAYQAGKVTDQVFLEALGKMKAADAVYDAAFAAAAEEELDAEDDRAPVPVEQMEMAL